MKLNIKKVHPEAVIPSYAHPGDAGMDLYTVERIAYAPGELKAIKTGIAMEIPEGYVGLIWDKSSVAGKGGMKMMGGVIDAGYRGEVMVSMINLSTKEYVFEKGHKVGQMLIQQVTRPEISEVAELGQTSRGSGAFGSTGK